MDWAQIAVIDNLCSIECREAEKSKVLFVVQVRSCISLI
jgi:hypothetical protein